LQKDFLKVIIDNYYKYFKMIYAYYSFFERQEDDYKKNI